MVRIQNKIFLEISIFELPRLENCISMLCPCISMLCPAPLSDPPPPQKTTQIGEKHTKKVKNMFYMGYFIFVNGEDINFF